MSDQISPMPPRLVPQVPHIELAKRRLPVMVGGRVLSKGAQALLGPGGEVPPPGALPLRQACAVIHQMTAELLSFTAERVQVRRVKRRAECHTRQIAMYVCHVTLRIPQGDVAHAYGRDRTTVRYSCAVVEDRRDSPGYDDFVGAVERLAGSVFQPVEGDFDDEH